MLFDTTSYLLEQIGPFVEKVDVQISTDHKDWRGRSYQSDLVRIGDGSHVRFEVFEDEVIVGFFTDHCHYEDRYSYLEEGEPDYIRRAGAFLKELFTYPVRHVANFKGKTLVAERYFLCYDDGREECPVGWTWYGLVRWINPFGKKRVVSTVWKFDRTKGTFVEMSAEER